MPFYKSKAFCLRLAGGKAAAKERSDAAEGLEQGRRRRQTKALKALQGRANLRAAEWPDPPEGRGSPK